MKGRKQLSVSNSRNVISTLRSVCRGSGLLIGCETAVRCYLCAAPSAESPTPSIDSSRSPVRRYRQHVHRRGERLGVRARLPSILQWVDIVKISSLSATTRRSITFPTARANISSCPLNTLSCIPCRVRHFNSKVMSRRLSVTVNVVNHTYISKVMPNIIIGGSIRTGYVYIQILINHFLLLPVRSPYSPHLLWW